MRAAWFLIVALLAVAPSARAQEEAQPPAEVQRVANAALDYVQALRVRVADQVIEDTDTVFNAPPSEIQASIDRTRASNAEGQARVAALPRPDLRGQDIDLTFMGDWLRERVTHRLALGGAAITAAQGMLDAQSSGDCAALETHAADLDRLRVERRMANPWTDVSMLDQTLGRFAPNRPGPIPVAVDPPDANARYDERVLAMLARIVAKSLRCPRPEPDVRIELTVRLGTDGSISTTVASISQGDLRRSVEQRVASARFPSTYMLRNSLLLNRPLRFVYANQRVTPAQ